MKTDNLLRNPIRRKPLSHAVALCLTFGSSAAYAAMFNVSNNNDAGAGSLREAVLSANASAGADEITFDPELGTILLTSGQIDISETLSITGPVTGQIISGNDNSRILAFTNTAQNLTLENLTLTNGRTTSDGDFPTNCNNGLGQGGAVCSAGSLTLINSTVTSSATNGEGAFGGGVFADVSATLINSTISSNSTDGDYAYGGGIAARNITITGSNVTENSTSGYSAYGGGVDSLSAAVTNSYVSNNNTAGDYAYGGGINAGTATIDGSTVTSNSTTGSDAKGGGIHTNYAVTLTNCTVSENSTTGDFADGGGIYDNGNTEIIDGGEELMPQGIPIGIVTTSISSSIISGNSTDGIDSDGGGIDANNATITDSRIFNNSTTKIGAEGGGIDAKTANLINTTVSGNSTAGEAAEGGGINVSFNATFTNTTVSGNSTTGNQAEGGGIDAGAAILTNSTVSGNSTAGENAPGGGINLFAEGTINNSTITDNRTTGPNSPSGGLYQVGGANETITLNSTILANNSVIGNSIDNFAFNAANNPTLAVNFSLFGDPVVEITGANNNNVLTNIPDVAVLMDNGCATQAGTTVNAACVQTHALQAGSLALDAGSNPLTLATDQRGAGFSRVFSAQADIGAFENSAVNGVCGNDNGQFLTSTPINLCTTGNPSAVVGSGPWSWTCDGSNGGSSVSCSANLPSFNITSSANPVIGGSVSCIPNPVINGSDSTCSVTVDPGYTFINWTGDCTGSSCQLNAVTSAKNVTANFALIVDSACGVDNGQTLTSTPSNLCTEGSASAVSGIGPWSWFCTSTSGGATSNCTADLQTYTITFSSNPIASGAINCIPNPVNHGASTTCSATPDSGFIFIDWTGDCSGNSCTLNNVSNPPNILANFVSVNEGACGTDDGQILASTPVNLCIAGAATPVSGTGPWSWTCTGDNGGNNASCNADIGPIESRPIPVMGPWTIAGLSMLLGLLGWRKNTHRNG